MASIEDKIRGGVDFKTVSCQSSWEIIYVCNEITKNNDSSYTGEWDTEPETNKQKFKEGCRVTQVCRQ